MKKVMKKKIVKNKSVSEKNVNALLVGNFVSLQKVMTNLSISFNELSGNISKLLELFELSAQAMAKKEINFTKPMDEAKIIHKLNGLAEQNKIIARGISLMHEKTEPAEAPKPLMKTSMPVPKKMPPQKEEYQKSPFSKGF